MLRIEPEDADALLQVDQLLLLRFHLLLEVAELERKEVGDALRGLVAGLQVALDEVADEPVDDVGGELWVKRLAADLDEVGLRYNADVDVTIHAVQRALANVQIVE